MTKDIPIIFSVPMVRALLEGRKTQTRRIIGELPPAPAMDAIVHHDNVRHAAPYFDAYCSEPKSEENPRGMSRNWCWWTRDDRQCLPTVNVKYAPGDRLWVRENIWQASPYPGTLPSGEPDESCRWSSRLVTYSADGSPPNTPNRHYPNGFREGCGAFSAPDPYASWLQRPSIHMPRWASRLSLICEGVKVERLNDISEADAIAEGVVAMTGQFEGCFTVPGIDAMSGTTAKDCFERLWCRINGPNAWRKNPFVVAPSFRVIKANIDAPEARAA